MSILVENCDPPVPKEALAGPNIANLEVAIYYTPIDNGDQAHSDLTFTGPVPEEPSEAHDSLVMALSGKFNALHPDQISLLPNANVTTERQQIAERLQSALLAVMHKLRP